VYCFGWGEIRDQTSNLGVPQGTVLTPILFLLFINNLPDNNDSTVRLFAEDCVLYREIKPSQIVMPFSGTNQMAHIKDMLPN
jgi:hypothetical protein